MQHPQIFVWAQVLLVSMGLCTAAVLVFALGMRRYPGMLLWVFGGASVTLGTWLVLMQGKWPLLLSVVGANLAFVGGSVCLAAGQRLFLGKRVPWRWYLALLGLLTGLASWFTFGQFNLSARVLVFGLCMSSVQFEMAATMFRAFLRGSPWPSLVLAVCSAVAAMFYLLRGLGAGGGLLGDAAFLHQTGVNIVAYGAFVVGPPVVIIQTAGFLLLAGYRSARELSPDSA